MLTPLREPLPESCLSDLTLDEWHAEELSTKDAEYCQRHLSSCERCQARDSELRAQAAAFLDRFPEPKLPELSLPLSSVVQPSVAKLSVGQPSYAEPSASAPVQGIGVHPKFQSKARRLGAKFWAAGGALAAAAVILLLLQTPHQVAEAPFTTRTKGESRLGVFIKRQGQVFPGSTGDTVHPGDQLRFTVTTTAPRHIAIFSKDGAGVVSTYYPSGAQSKAIEVSRDAPLPSSVRLDATLGTEHLWGLLCEQPFALAPVVQQLQLHGKPLPAAGCVIHPLTLNKTERP